jgi:transcriptional regulator with XRE-family HTH domain
MEKLDFAEWLRDQINLHGWSQAEFSRRSGISAPQITRLLNREQRPGEDSIIGISRALGLPTETVLRAAGILPPIQETEDIIERILYELGGTKIETKQQALEIIRALKKAGGE